MSKKLKCGCTCRCTTPGTSFVSGSSSGCCELCREYLNEYNNYFITQESERYLCEDCHELGYNVDCDPLTKLEERISSIEEYLEDVKKILRHLRLGLND